MALQDFMDALKKNRYSVSCFQSASEAAQYLEEKISGKTVGFGDSATLKALDLNSRLSKRNEVHNPATASDEASFLHYAAQAMSTQIFLTSVNAAAMTGELINIDGTGNRIAGSLFGHEKVYFVIGKNKIEPTLEKALWRARNIAAPRNAQRLKLKTPCAVKADKWYNCSSPDRICNGLVIHWKKNE